MEEKRNNFQFPMSNVQFSIDFCFDKVLNFLSYRARSEYEINFYMLRKAWPEDVRVEIINKLKHLKLIDDEDFSRQWIASRSRGRISGRSLLKAELRKKGIAKELIDRLVSEERGSASEEILAEKAIEKKLAKMKDLPVMEQKNKLYGQLLRKGFSSSTAEGVIDKLLKKE